MTSCVPSRTRSVSTYPSARESRTPIPRSPEFTDPPSSTYRAAALGRSRTVSTSLGRHFAHDSICRRQAVLIAFVHASATASLMSSISSTESAAAGHRATAKRATATLGARRNFSRTMPWDLVAAGAGFMRAPSSRSARRRRSRNLHQTVMSKIFLDLRVRAHKFTSRRARDPLEPPIRTPIG